MVLQSGLKVPSLFLIIVISCINLSIPVASFSFCTPNLGIGSIIFRPKGMKVKPSLSDDEKIVQAAKCFTDAFWTSKLEKGNKELTPAQYKSIEPRQISEFRRRYGNGNARRSGIKSELLIATDSTATVLGCAGVEVDTIRQPWSSGKMVLDVSGSQVRAPLMSNLAVSRSFRRRGIAEELVQQVEELVRKQWGFEECYLYVEKKNSSAIKLYKKLGYKQVWEEENTSTMVPSPMGGLRSGTTTTICMKKVLNKGLFGRFLGL